MEKIKQNTNCRRWASLWLVMAMAVMTAIFLRGGVVVQAEENENSVSIVSQSIVNNTTSDEGSMNLTVSKGDSITMSVDIGDSNVEGYHWYNNRTDEEIKDATSSSLTVTKGNGSEAYRCEAYNSYDDGYNCDTAYFYLDVKDTINTVRYYVNDAEVEDGDIYNTKPGKQYRLRVEPESSYDGATYEYQWYKDEDILSEETSSEIIVTKSDADTDDYSVVITNNKGTVYTISFRLNKKTNFSLSILSYINEDYYDTEESIWTYKVKEGQKAKLYVDVKASSGEKIKYNWQKYDNEENTYISIDNTTDTYTTDAISSEERYRCVITCNGEEYNSEFMIGVEGENDNTFETSSYIKVNGEEVVDDTAEVRSGSNITLGVNIRQLPSGIKESDVSYAWYKGDAWECEDPWSDWEDKKDCLSTTNECQISNISETASYYCKIKLAGKVQTPIDFTINVSNITGKILFDGKEWADNIVKVDSVEELVGKKLTADVSNAVDSTHKLSYKWYKLTHDDEGEDVKELLGGDKEYTLSKEDLSEGNLDLECEVTDTQTDESKNFIFYISQIDHLENGKKYINDECTGSAQISKGNQVSLKVVFPNNVSKEMKYQWYDEDYNKLSCTDSECVVTMGEERETYRCVVTDKNGWTESYEFALYSVNDFVPQQYVNGKKFEEVYYEVKPNTTVKMEIRMTPSDNVTYQWYLSNNYRKKAIKGEANSTYIITSDAEIGKEESYACLVTRGNDRKWTHFNIYTKDKACSHINVESLPAVPATCEKDGLTEGKRCRECGETIVEQEVVKATGHKWDNGTVTKPATATKTGVKTFTCTVCKKTKTEVIPKLTTNNTVNNDTTKKPETIETSLKTGTKVTDKKSKAVYKVTGNNTVQYTKASGKKVRKAKKVAIPAAVTVNGVKYQVTAIAPNAFKNNKNLKTIIIPATVRSIGKQAFAGCKNLKSIIIRTPYLTKKSVGAKAFKGISSKAVIKVPKKQLKAYKKLLKTKGVAKSVKIK